MANKKKKSDAERWKYGCCYDDSVQRRTNNGYCRFPATGKDGLCTLHRNGRKWKALDEAINGTSEKEKE